MSIIKRIESYEDPFMPPIRVCLESAVRQLEDNAERVVRALLDMLIEGECYYNLLPNSHRKSALEYYSDEIKAVERLTGKTYEQLKDV